jgi:hypothetical protein
LSESIKQREKDKGLSEKDTKNERDKDMGEGVDRKIL